MDEEKILTAEHLAQLIVESIDRHGLRGLIYEADGMTDVVMHGKVDMVAVARDILIALDDR
jgi:2,4-dienoyl-CoA reductase-like NADH-dependent reductase (Old Yellow Enzyme family)